MNRRKNNFGQALQGQFVIGLKIVRLGRKNLDQSNDHASRMNWGRDHGADSEGTTAFAVHPRIGFGIVTTEKYAGAHTFSRKA